MKNPEPSIGVRGEKSGWNSKTFHRGGVRTKNGMAHYAPPKCTSLQNYIVNLDLHVHCESPNDYIRCSCPCAPPEHVCCELAVNHRQNVSVCSMFHLNHQRMKECWGWPLLLKDVLLGSLVHHGAQCMLLMHNTCGWCTI